MLLWTSVRTPNLLPCSSNDKKLNRLIFNLIKVFFICSGQLWDKNNQETGLSMASTIHFLKLIKNLK